MAAKPESASGYSYGQLDRVRATCLYVATKLGDLLQELTIVGGLVPSLLVDQRKFESADDRHVGTNDLDVGLSVAIFDSQRYQEISARLREAKFAPDVNDRGNPTRQRWKIDLIGDAKITMDFLIAPTRDDDKPSEVRSIEGDFGALITPGLHLAFHDRERVTIDGRTILGERAKRDVWVAGPGAFTALKALALRGRGVNKDAYDLYYVLRYFDLGLEDVARRLAPHRRDPAVDQALAILREDFAEIDSIGPSRVARFLRGNDNGDDDLQADARGLVLDLLRFFD